MHYDFMRSMDWCKKDVTPFLTHLSCVFLALTHRNENTFCTRTFMCPWLVARTTFWTNTRVAGELRFHSLWLIHFSRPTCMWNGAEIFSWVFPRVQPQYSPKPIQILVNTLRPEQWWLMFGTHFFIHFLDMKLTKICWYAESVIKLVCWLTRLRHNNILPHKHHSGATCA